MFHVPVAMAKGEHSITTLEGHFLVYNNAIVQLMHVTGFQLPLSLLPVILMLRNYHLKEVISLNQEAKRIV